MDERVLLILGLLQSQSQHGYQINEFIERNLGRVSEMKKATAYAILKRLHTLGYVDVQMEQEGKRPARHLYSITPRGERKFHDLLRASLTQVENVTPVGEIGLMFIDHMTQTEVIECLQQRLTKLQQLIARYEKAPNHSGVGINLSIEHRLALLRFDREWLINTLQKLEQGTLSIN